ncbi:FACR102Wp [Eremothecium gossypii FDAG1]|nr:FACR102Wp [Eremothecium gossypii FDAG1]
MVDVREFFKANSGNKPSAKGPPRKKAKIEEAKLPKGDAASPIDVDLDDDDLEGLLEAKGEEKVVKREERPAVKKQPKQGIQSAGGVGSGRASAAPVGNAQEILAALPSVDLDSVHVKEGANFGFGGSGESGGDANADDFAQGAPNCLLGLTMVFTGVLPNIDRPAAEALAKKYGARVTKSISSKTSVVVLGDEAGPKKLEKIRQLGIKAIDENGFRQLINAMPAEGGSGVAAERARQQLKKQEEDVLREAETLARQEKERAASRASSAPGGHAAPRESDQLWTVKYAPTSLSQICGNKSSVGKLHKWLSEWDNNQRNGFKTPGRDGTGIYRAAMLYGPPGIGKTTAAHLVANELGYDVLEQNASDVRSKKLLNEGIKNALDNTSVIGYFNKKEHRNSRKFVIIMDEVDGMSGGDRGGVGQMAQFCRKTSSPLILICNERTLPKMRPFDRVVCDIQFRRPDAQSMKARLMTIAVREGFKLDPTVVDQLVAATRGDIRQIINLLSTISTTTKSIGHDNARQISAAWEKNIALKPYDITHKLFEGRNYSDAGAQSFPLYKKMELYFDDFDFTPLMVQENYLSTRPTNLSPGQSHLQAAAAAADSISEGDLVDRKIRSGEQLWSLLPFHAVMSSVRPASLVSGQMAGRINFTSWLGQNSKTGKYYRLLQELHYHTRLRTSASKVSFRLDYLTTLKRRLLSPLVENGGEAIPNIIETMDSYYLTKEDWDVVMDFMLGYENTEAALKKISTSDKRAFTTMYNKTTHPVAINRTGTTIAISGKSGNDKPDFEEVVDADDEVPPDNDDAKNDESADLKKDKLIKERKPRARKATGSSKAPAKRKKVSK